MRSLHFNWPEEKGETRRAFSCRAVVPFDLTICAATSTIPKAVLPYKGARDSQRSSASTANDAPSRAPSVHLPVLLC